MLDEGSADVLLWLTYCTNVVTEATAILIIAFSYWFRIIGTLFLATPYERVCFLMRSNAIGLISSLTAFMVLSLMALIGLGGLLAHNDMGFAAVAVFPANVILFNVCVHPSVVSSLRRMLVRAQRITKQAEKQAQQAEEAHLAPRVSTVGTTTGTLRSRFVQAAAQARLVKALEQISQAQTSTQDGVNSQVLGDGTYWANLVYGEAE